MMTDQTSPRSRVAIIGAGPAGLMGAEYLSERGFSVTVFDAMQSFGRKFLMAGKSGLNITHAEDTAAFLSRYELADPRLTDAVQSFGSRDIQDWMAEFEIPGHVGSTGRVFPTMMKASPLLRAWLQRLAQRGVEFKTRHRWQGWTEGGELTFRVGEGTRTYAFDAVLLALGGGSWARLGSDGAWRQVLGQRGVETSPFQPSNCGFLIEWSDHMRAQFAGVPVKSVALSTKVGGKTHVARGEFVITHSGIESGGVYTLSRPLREAWLKTGTARVDLDLAPDLDLATLVQRLKTAKSKDSLSNKLRKAANLSPVKRALVFEFGSAEDVRSPESLAALIKTLPMKLSGMAPIDEAISTVGGISWDAIDIHFMLREKAGVFCAGEMIDWDAPTGGYLITACLATGRAAAKGVDRWLSR